MTIKGAYSIIFKLPKVKRQMQFLSYDELNDPGDVPPEPKMYDTFYCADKFLCAPSAYSLIRFRNIALVTPNAVTSNGRQSGVFINVEFADGTPCVDIDIKNWGTFQKELSEFMSFIEQKKIADRMSR